MKTTTTYYRDSVDGYHGITPESPAGFAGCVFVGKGPEHRGGPETIREQGYTPNQVQRWTKVEPADVPDEWFDAIDYDERPEPEPEPEPAMTPEQIWEGYEKALAEAPRSELFDDMMQKVQSGEWHLPEIPLDYKPERKGMDLFKDPWFWPTAAAVFIVFSYVFGGCI